MCWEPARALALGAPQAAERERGRGCGRENANWRKAVAIVAAATASRQGKRRSNCGRYRRESELHWGKPPESMCCEPTNGESDGSPKRQGTAKLKRRSGIQQCQKS